MNEKRKNKSYKGKKQRRTYMPKEIRRKMIADAARPIFAKKRFKGTTIEDICTASGIAPRTLYLHFKNKKEVFELVVSDIREKLSVFVKETLHENKQTTNLDAKIDENEAYNFIRQKNYNVFKMVKENRDLLLILLREASSFSFNVYYFLKTTIDSLLELVKTEQNVFQTLGLIKNLDSRYSSQVIVGSMLIAMLYEIIENDCDDLEQLTDMITKLQFYGFGLPHEEL